jgi:predicted nucleotide-binding protein
VVFLVHGHDHGTRETVARFLEKAGSPEVVILDEQPDEGRTLLEKLEDHAHATKYAVVLLTSDDIGRAKDVDREQPRARQNVVFELGWFCGELGRKRVAVLCAPGVERPSDLQGLVYIPLEGDWERRLVRELVKAGFDYSLDKLHA